MPTLTTSSLLWNAKVIAASGTADSAPIAMDRAEALALHLTSITGAGPSVTFTYKLSADGITYVTPQSPVTIGATKSAVDVMDFAPEAANWIIITATNNNGAQQVTITARLSVQEKY